jgi:hypothetical protein
MILVREGFRRASARGITLGSEARAILAQYGAPTRRLDLTHGRSWDYDAQRIAFQLRGGRIVSWLVFERLAKSSSPALRLPPRRGAVRRWSAPALERPLAVGPTLAWSYAGQVACRASASGTPAGQPAGQDAFRGGRHAIAAALHQATHPALPQPRRTPVAQ